MAPRDDRDGWSRLREREEEDEREREEELQSQLLKNRLQPGGQSKGAAAGDLAREAASLQSSGLSEKFVQLLDRIEPLLEQVHLLYGQYFGGVERLPPIERRKHLDQTMHSLSLMPKPTPALQFRFNTVQSRFRSYTEQWDRRLRELESGKGGRKP
ncbi:MAG: hypothetical protein RJB38_2130 [Pseudomonadota bacterium]|jgi:hypothetical protein